MNLSDYLSRGKCGQAFQDQEHLETHIVNHVASDESATTRCDSIGTPELAEAPRVLAKKTGGPIRTTPTIPERPRVIAKRTGGPLLRPKGEKKRLCADLRLIQQDVTGKVLMSKP